MEPLEAKDKLSQAIKEQVDVLAKEWLTYDLEMLLKKTRQEPGLNHIEISYILKKVFDQSELDVLKKLI